MPLRGSLPLVLLPLLLLCPPLLALAGEPAGSSPPAAAGSREPLARVLGEHVLLEATAADSARLDDLAFVERAVAEACSEADLTVVLLKAHRFAPQGVSVVAVLAESHLSVHTWPELGYAAIDAYTCGVENKAKARVAAVAVAEAVAAQDYHVSTVARGIPSDKTLREAARSRDAGRQSAAPTNPKEL